MYNLGFDDAYQDTDCNLELYETNIHYRRGYDAGERTREEDVTGDWDDLSDAEREFLYGNEKDQV